AAQGGQLCARRLRHGLGITIARGTEVVEQPDDIQDVRQLHGALDLRVAGEDLLQQRGSGARQADDEDRRGTGITGVAVRGKECRIKEAADARAAALEAVDVERRIEAAQLVTAGVVGEGLRVAAPLLAGPAEREIHLRLVAAIALVCRQQLLHRGDLRIAEGVVLEIGQVPVRLAATRIHLQSCLVGGLAVMAAAGRRRAGAALRTRRPRAPAPGAWTASRRRRPSPRSGDSPAPSRADAGLRLLPRASAPSPAASVRARGTPGAGTRSA